MNIKQFIFSEDPEKERRKRNRSRSRSLTPAAEAYQVLNNEEDVNEAEAEEIEKEIEKLQRKKSKIDSCLIK